MTYRNDLDAAHANIETQKNKIEELEGKLKEKEKKPQKHIEKEKIDWGKIWSGIKIALAGALVLTLVATAVSILIWACAPLKKQAYVGTITMVTQTTKFQKIKTVTKTASNNNKMVPKSTNTKIIYTCIDVLFRNRNDNKTERTVCTNEGYNWDTELFLNYAMELPTKVRQNGKVLYIGNIIPYIGCKAKVYDLVGRALNTGTLRSYIIDASMCKKPKSEKSAN